MKTLDDDDDDEKDLIADEIFHGDGDGELEEGEAVHEPLQQADDDEEGEEEESGKGRESNADPLRPFCKRSAIF